MSNSNKAFMFGVAVGLVGYYVYAQSKNKM